MSVHGSLTELNSLIIPIVLVVGFIFIIIRPYYAFLFGTFISIAISLQTGTNTRIEELGSYFNLYDACFYTTILAFLADLIKRKKSLDMPKIPLALLAVLVIGLLTSTFSLIGLSYGVLRAMKWAIGLPLGYIMVANVVDDEKRLKFLLITMLAGTIASSLQYFFLASSINVGELSERDPEAFRTTAFTLAAPEVWLLAGPFMIGNRIPRIWLQLGVGALLLAVFFFNQARSTTLGFFLTLPVCYLWLFKGPHLHRMQRFVTLIKVFATGLIVFLLFNFTALPKNTFEKIYFSATKSEDDVTLVSRKNALSVEWEEYLDGNFFNLLFGRGLNYHEVYLKGLSQKKLPDKIGWGHQPYVAYLAQLGLAGFLIYAIILPFSVIRNSRELLQQPELSPFVTQLALLGGALFINKFFIHFFSESYQASSIYPGILAGALWRFSIIQHAKNHEVKESYDVPYIESSGPIET